MIKYFQTGKQLGAYLKKRCINYDPQRIFILPKISHTFGFLIIQDGEFVHVTSIYSSEDAELFVAILDDYFAGLGWDPATYWQFYGDATMPVEMKAAVFQLAPTDYMAKSIPPSYQPRPAEGVPALDVFNVLNQARVKYPNTGIMRLPRPPGGQYAIWQQGGRWPI